MADYAILNERHEVVRVPGVTEWALWFERGPERRRVDDSFIGDSRISTVFIGLDDSFGKGRAIWFETVVFGGTLDGERARYSTWDEAVAGHAFMVERVKAGATDAPKLVGTRDAESPDSLRETGHPSPISAQPDLKHQFAEAMRCLFAIADIFDAEPDAPYDQQLVDSVARQEHELERLRAIEDMREFAINGDGNAALVSALRAVQAQLLAGRDRHALSVVNEALNAVKRGEASRA